ncbi:MAG: response regulator transcription factor [Lachnospiraceae bacterium]|nr:response regulator transcription factor [Lachnospiraceae bacterium]
MKIAICDDEALCRTQLITLLKEYINAHEVQEISYAAFSRAEDLLATREAQGSFDVYILDIMMPDTNGIDLGVKLRKKGDDGIIIYLTSSKEFAIDSYSAKASGYLLKPVLPQHLTSALEEAYATVVNKTQDGTFVKTKAGLVRIPFDSILYVELCKRTAIYHLTNNKTEESTSLRIPFAESMQELLKDKRFILCAQGILVNLSHIVRIEDTQVFFSGNHNVYFSSKICKTLRSQWTDFYFS